MERSKKIQGDPPLFQKNTLDSLLASRACQLVASFLYIKVYNTMTMRYVALAECDDCPPTPVIDKDYLSICKIDDEYLGITRCQY